jgi:hypothetical protein
MAGGPAASRAPRRRDPEVEVPEPAVQVPARGPDLERPREERCIDDDRVVLAVLAEGVGARVRDLAQELGVELAAEQSGAQRIGAQTGDQRARARREQLGGEPRGPLLPQGPDRSQTRAPAGVVLPGAVLGDVEVAEDDRLDPVAALPVQGRGPGRFVVVPRGRAHLERAAQPLGLRADDVDGQRVPQSRSAVLANEAEELDEKTAGGDRTVQGETRVLAPAPRADERHTLKTEATHLLPLTAPGTTAPRRAPPGASRRH